MKTYGGANGEELSPLVLEKRSGPVTKKVDGGDVATHESYNISPGYPGSFMSWSLPAGNN